MSAYTPQQAWSVAYSDTIVKNCGLESVFSKLGGEIKERSRILDKSLRVKIAAWLAKLSEETRNEVWKKNRNAYAKLLLEQLKCGRLEEPFNANPPAAPLPTLNKALLYPYTKPKTSTGNNTSSIVRPERLQMTPSQQLDTYLSYHGGDAASSAPRAALPSPLPFDSLNTPISRLHHLDGNIEYLNTAASCVQQQQHHPVESSSWDNGGVAIDSLGSVADTDVELRLADAEERLQQHSKLLSLFLDVTSAEHQLQQVELGEEVGRQPRQQQQQRSVAEVLERAERGIAKRVTSPSKSYKPHRDGISSSKEGIRAISFPAPVAKSVSEESLRERLAHFDERTARLKSDLSNSVPYTSSLFYTSIGHYNTGRKSSLGVPVKGRKKSRMPPTASCVSSDTNSKSVSFIPARHTLKSTAAAVAARKSLENI
ncbi:hypothetical protein Ndes2526B_g07296 [Nannochloris sp. 'desiccata']